MIGSRPGFYGIGRYSGEFIPREDAEKHAMSQCGISHIDDDAPEAAEFRAALVEWYYSGAWIEVKKGEVQ